MNSSIRLLTVAAATLLVSAISHGAAHERDTFIKQYDSNHDGQVLRDEFDAARTQRFNVTDSDHDGRLDEGEYLVEYLAQLDAELAASKLTEAEKTAARQRQLRQLLVRFDVLDADHDQHIGKAEYDASGTRSFTNHDSDKDGVISVKDAPSDAAANATTR